jgi:hypothetical protein
MHGLESNKKPAKAILVDRIPATNTERKNTRKDNHYC